MLSSAGSKLYGQRIEFRNLILTNLPDSKIIYIGIDNFFQVSSVDRIKKVESSEASVTMISDTVRLRPYRTGKVNLSIETNEGRQYFTFDSYRLPELSLAITSDTFKYRKDNTIRRDDIMSFNKVELRTGKEDVGGFGSSYKVRLWEAQLNDETFIIKGERLSEELRRAISKCESGSALIIGNIEGYNAENGKRVIMSQKRLFSYIIQ
jgi:hypothetical protein